MRKFALRVALSLRYRRPFWSAVNLRALHRMVDDSDKVPSPFLQIVIKYNPLTYLVCTTRDVLIHGRVYRDEVGIYSACVLVAFVLFLVSLRLFYVSEQKLVERLI